MIKIERGKSFIQWRKFELLLIFRTTSIIIIAILHMFGKLYYWNIQWFYHTNQDIQSWFNDYFAIILDLKKYLFNMVHFAINKILLLKIATLN